MKKATKNTIRENYTNVIEVGYCELQHMLNYTEKKYSNSGVYGWNWDAYELDNNTCIVTGYRNTLGKKIDREFIKKIDNIAKQIENEVYNYEIKKSFIEDLKDAFLREYKNYLV